MLNFGIHLWENLFVLLSRKLKSLRGWVIILSILGVYQLFHRSLILFFGLILIWILRFFFFNLDALKDVIISFILHVLYFNILSNWMVGLLFFFCIQDSIISALFLINDQTLFLLYSFYLPHCWWGLVNFISKKRTSSNVGLLLHS